MSEQLLEIFLFWDFHSYFHLPLSPPCSVIMHHHLQEDASSSPATHHPVQTLHIHHGAEQHRVRPGCLHGRGLRLADGHQLPTGPVQLHGEHRQHEGPDGSHRGGQRSGARPRQPARHQQHHHHHCHRHHLCRRARLYRQQGAEGSAPQVPLHRDPGLWMSLLKFYSETLACSLTVSPPPSSSSSS